VNLQEIKAGTRNAKTIYWPGTTAEVVLRIVSKQESQEASFAADARFAREKLKVEWHNLEIFQEERSIQILYRALREVDTNAPLASSVEVFKSLVSTEDISALAMAYADFEAEVGGNLESATDAEVELMILELKKKPEQILGSVSSSATLKRLLRTLVAQLPS